MLENLRRGGGHIVGMLWLALCLGIWWPAAPAAWAKPSKPTPGKTIELPAYLQIALTTEEEPQIAQEQAAKAQVQALGAQSFLNLHGFLNPSYKKDKSPDSPDHQALQAKVKSALLSTGTSLEGSYTKSKFKEVAGKADFNQGEWSFKVVQSLGKNAFGRGQAAEGKALGATARQKAIEAQQGQLQTCTQAIKDFYEAFSAQAKAAIYQETYNLIKKRQQQLKANYKQHYVSQITYLQGTADALDMKEKLNEQRKLAQIARSQLARLGVQDDWALVDPRPLLETVRPPAKFDFNQSYRGQALGQEALAAKFKQDQARYNTYPQLDLSVEFKKVDPQTNQRQKEKEKTLTLQLETDFTIFDREITQEKQVAALDARIAQRKLHQDEQNFTKKIADGQQELQNQQEALALERQKTDLYRQATQEQLRRLRNAKIEFADYLEQRNKYIESRVAQLDLFKSILTAKLDLWLLSDQLPPICAGINP